MKSSQEIFTRNLHKKSSQEIFTKNLHKKGISPIIGTILLLVVAIVAVAGFTNWYQSYESRVFNSISQKENSVNLKTDIDSFIDNKLYFKSSYDKLSIRKVTLGGKDCNISLNISNGLYELNLSSECVNNQSDSLVDLVVYTDKGVFSKKVYLKNIKDHFKEDINSLPYWIENNSTIWTKVSLGPNSTKTIYLDLKDTYGQNGDEVFEFFDDFEDSNWETKYNHVNGNNIIILDSVLTLDYTAYFHHYWGIITKNDIWLSKNDYIVEYKAKTETNDAPKVAIWAKGAVSDCNWLVEDTYPFLCLIHDDGNSDTYTWTPIEKDWHYITGYDYKQWRLFKYHVHRDNLNGTNGYIEYLLFGDYGTDDNKIPTPFKLKAYKTSANQQYYGDKIFIGGEQDGDIFYDWIMVRKYAPQEPTTNITQIGTNKWKITIHNPNNGSLTDFQISFSKPSEITGNIRIYEII